MKKLTCLIFYLGLISISVYGQPQLRFKSKIFKIVQFTDLHFQFRFAPDELKGDSTLELMRYIIKKEKPNLVVLTGDLMTSEMSNLGGQEKGWEKITQPMADLQVPFVAVMGNHDYDRNDHGLEMMEMVNKNPYSLAHDLDDTIAGAGNCFLEIKDSKGSTNKWVLFFFDYAEFPKDKTLAERIRKEQFQWYLRTSDSLKALNDKPLPSLAFYHVPSSDFELVKAQNSLENKQEKRDSSKLSNELLLAFKQQGDVLAVFVGHHHNNDYIGVIDNLCLGYGRKTGFSGSGNLERGARIIKLYSKKRKIHTYIRTKTGRNQWYTFTQGEEYL